MSAMRTNYRKNWRMYSHAMYMWALFLLFLWVDSNGLQSWMHSSTIIKLHANSKMANRALITLVLIKFLKFLKIFVDGISSSISSNNNKDNMVYSFSDCILSTFYCISYKSIYTCYNSTISNCINNVINGSFSIDMPRKHLIMANSRHLLIIWTLTSFTIRYYLLPYSLHMQSYSPVLLNGWYRRFSCLLWGNNPVD